MVGGWEIVVDSKSTRRVNRVKIDIQKFIASRIMKRKLNGNNYLQLEEIAEINLNGHGKNNHIYTDLPTSKTDE